MKKGKKSLVLLGVFILMMALMSTSVFAATKAGKAYVLNVSPVFEKYIALKDASDTAFQSFMDGNLTVDDLISELNGVQASAKTLIKDLKKIKTTKETTKANAAIKKMLETYQTSIATFVSGMQKDDEATMTKGFTKYKTVNDLTDKALNEMAKLVE